MVLLWPGPLSSTETRNWPILAHFFSVAIGPFGRFWCPVRHVGPRKWVFFLVWAAFWGQKKHESLKLRDTYKTPSGSTKKARGMCVFGNLLLTSGKVHIAKMHVFFNSGLLIITLCFLPFAGRSKKKGPGGGAQPMKIQTPTPTVHQR